MIENLYIANEIFVQAGRRDQAERRQAYMQRSQTGLRLLEEIRDYAEKELKLEFNQKTQIFLIAQVVDYLGWHFYLTDSGKVIRRLRTSNKRRFKRRLKLLRRQYAAGEKDLESIKRSLASYRGHLSHGNTWKLREKVFRNFVMSRPSQCPANSEYNFL